MNPPERHPPERRPLASPAEVAEYLQLEETTLANWRWRKTGPRWSKAGRYVRYSWDDVDAWMAEHEPAPSPKAPRSAVV